MNKCLTVARDGFVWYGGAKLPCKVTARGLEFHEKDPRRAASIGGALFVVPFEAIENLIDLSKQVERNETDEEI